MGTKKREKRKGKVKKDRRGNKGIGKSVAPWMGGWAGAEAMKKKNKKEKKRKKQNSMVTINLTDILLCSTCS